MSGASTARSPSDLIGAAIMVGWSGLRGMAISYTYSCLLCRFLNRVNNDDFKIVGAASVD